MLSELHVVAGVLRLLRDASVEIIQLAQPDDFGGVGLGFLFVTELQVARAALEIKLRVVPLTSDRLREVGDGGLVVFQLEVSQARLFKALMFSG